MKSMTAYAKKSFLIKDYGEVCVEIKSLNGKSLSIFFKMPNELNSIEYDLRKDINRMFKKGTINILLTVDYANVFLNKVMDKKIKIIKELFNKSEKEKYLPFFVNSFNNMIHYESFMNKKIENEIKMNITGLLIEMNKVREKEGKKIKIELIKYIEILEGNIKIIESNSKSDVKKKRKKLKEMINKREELIDDAILIYAEKIDINEEIFRFKMHLKNLREESNGSSYLFTLQELLREINTIGAKTENYQVSKKVIEIKENLEKMREQVMNVE